MSQPGFTKSSEAEQQHLPPERARWPLWPWLLVIAALLVVLVVWAGIGPTIAPLGERHPAVGKRLTTFRLEPLTGDAHPVGIDDLTTKATLVNFWGPWCGACVVEFPHLVELVEHFQQESEFQFFSVSTNFDPLDEEGLAEGTEKFLIEHKATFPAHRDPKVETTRALIKAANIEDFGYPTTVLLGPGGTIRGIWMGFVEGDETAIRLAVEKALAVKAK